MPLAQGCVLQAMSMINQRWQRRTSRQVPYTGTNVPKVEVGAFPQGVKALARDVFPIQKTSIARVMNGVLERFGLFNTRCSNKQNPPSRTSRATPAKSTRRPAALEARSWLGGARLLAVLSEGYVSTHEAGDDSGP